MLRAPTERFLIRSSIQTFSPLLLFFLCFRSDTILVSRAAKSFRRRERTEGCNQNQLPRIALFIVSLQLPALDCFSSTFYKSTAFLVFTTAVFDIPRKLCQCSNHSNKYPAK